MGHLKEHFFYKIVSDALGKAIEEYQEQYTKKKGRRFNVNDITYELGEVRVQNNAIEFEMSNKIPEKEITEEYTIEKYFADVKKVLASLKVSPDELDMDEIVRRGAENEVKKRDYVRLKFRRKLSKLYNDKALIALYQDIQSGKNSMEIVKVQGINSPLGSLALNIAGKSAYDFCKENMENLIKANDMVRSK